MTKPSDYRHIAAWHRLSGSMQYYINDLQHRAMVDGAPIDATWFDHDDKRWHRIGDAVTEQQDRVNAELQRMK